ncbi:uncharacterized protein LOC119840673 [Zerene cesonia]|uniref:uncharacterized protein LOC119840673 n=1 Tax=Zerene cesonia TaxID=33412 RepID=UPI0018E5502B|nr:uncharacterized protein LOC119840673 [Zerene cesonia]
MPRRLSDVWEHFQVLSESGRKKHGLCVYCKKEYKYSNSTRLAAHIVQCDSCPIDIRNMYRNQLERLESAHCSKPSTPSAKHFLHNKVLRKKLRRRLNISEYFKITNEPGQKTHAYCVFCSTEFKQVNTEKLISHLQYCTKCPMDVKNKMKNFGLPNAPNNSYDPQLIIKKSTERPKVWEHFRIISKEGYKRHAACKYCDAEYKYSNATRLVVHLCRCPNCPNDVKNLFLEYQSTKSPPHPSHRPISIKTSPSLGRPLSDVWQYFKINHESGYKRHTSCMFCGKEYRHSNATRLLKHIVECEKCPKPIKNNYLAGDSHSSSDDSEGESMPSEASSNEAEYSLEQTLIKKDDTAAVCDNENASTSSFIGNNHIVVEVNVENVDDDIDATLARAIFTSGVPFSLLDSKYWKKAINMLRPDYNIPSALDFSCRLLEGEHARFRENIDNEIKESDMLVLICDEIRIDEKELLCFMIATASKTFCYKIVLLEYKKCEIEVKKKKCNEEISKVINEIGPEKILAIITESNWHMTQIQKILVGTFPTIAGVCCLFGTMYSIFRDIVEESLIKGTTYDVEIVVKYLKNEVSKGSLSSVHTEIINSLKLPNPENWKDFLFQLELLMKYKNALQTLVLSNTVFIEEGIKMTILSERWWDGNDKCIRVVKQYNTALTEAESDKTIISDVPAIFSKLLSNIENEIISYGQNYESDKYFIRATINNRRKNFIQPIHMAANLLDPRYVGSMLNDEEMIEAMSYISSYATSLTDDPGEIMKNLAEFKTKTGYFAKVKAIWTSANLLEPRIWWKSFCSHLKISEIAIKLLSVPCSIPCGYKSKLFTEVTQNSDQQDIDRSIKLATIRANYFFENKIDEYKMSE